MPFVENNARWLRWLALPAAPFYALAVRIRNFLFDKGLRERVRPSFPVICVGNLCAGGSGKTPLTEYIVRLLGREHAVGIVSRGYGRNRKGEFLAEPGMDSRQIGDEPVQYLQEFAGKLPRGFGLYIAANRANGLRALKGAFPEMEAAVLDDAYQHRRVEAGFNILVSDFSKPFFRDYLLPLGTLREGRSGSRRAQAVVFSKCPPGMTLAEKEAFLEDLPLHAGQEVFFTTISYGPFRPGGQIPSRLLPETKNILLFTGIANPKPLEDHLRQSGYRVVAHRRFADHHDYSPEDARALISQYDRYRQESGELLLLTTQKDYSRMKDTPAFAYFCSLPLAYVPIRTEFLFGEGEAFDRRVLSFVEGGQRAV